MKCPPKQQKSYCDLKTCRGKNCGKFTAEQLKVIHEDMRCYNTKVARNAFIRENVERYDVHKRKPSKNLKHRSSSFRYYLTLTEAEGVQIKLEVCQQTFLAVTGFREIIVRQNAVNQGEPVSKKRGMYGRRGEKAVADN